MENELFWRSMTSAGYAGYISERVSHLKSLSTSSSWMDTFDKASNPEDAAMYKSISKAVKYRSVHQREQFGGDKRTGRRNDSDSDDD